MTSRTRLAAALVVGLGVFVVLSAVQARSAPSASVIVALDEDQVSWPYHDSVRQTATGGIISNPDALAAARSAAAPGTIDELTTAMRDGQSYFEVSASGSDSDATSAGVDAVMDWAVSQNLHERRNPLEEEESRLELQVRDLSSGYQSDDLSSEDALARSRAEESASLIAQYERRLVEIDEELAGIRPQFAATSPAAPGSNPLRPLLSGIGAFFAAIAAFVLSEPAGERVR